MAGGVNFTPGNGGPATNVQLYEPYGVAEDTKGNSYFAEAGRSVIRKVKTDGVIPTIAGQYDAAMVKSKTNWRVFDPSGPDAPLRILRWRRVVIRAYACVAGRRFAKAPRLFPILLMIAMAMPAQDRPQRNAGKSARRDPLDAETSKVADAFWQKILPQCGDSYYYAGSELEVHIQGRAGAARANNGLTEYAGVTFPFPGDQLPVSAADEANGVERKGESFMVPARWRERTPGQNTWQKWVSPSADSNAFSALDVIASAPSHYGFTGLMAIELWKVKGQWYYLLPGAIDPMRQLIPASDVTPRKISCNDVLHTAGLPPITKNGKFSSAPDVHCRDSLNNPVAVEDVLREDARRWCGITPERWDELNGKHTPPLPAAPGHSLTDTYSQAEAIAQGNASKGIRDSINPSYLKARLPLPVCYSVDATGNCQKSGETIWLPGDLARPLDWNKFSQTGACRPPQPDQIEVTLKSTATDDKRKRYIRCVEAGIVASVRKDLADLGVKDDAPTGMASATPLQSNAPAAPQPSPPSPGSIALEIVPGKDAITTRAFADPRGRGPGCEIPEGTLVLVQSIDKQSGKAQLFVLPNGKRDSKTCTNFLMVDRSELRAVAGYPTPK